MAIGKRIEEAIDKLGARDIEGALIPLCIAVAATARKEYPSKNDNQAFKAFIREHIRLITQMSVKGGVYLGFSHPRIKRDDDLCPLEDILYHGVRCELIHEGEIRSKIRFEWGGKWEVRREANTIVLPAELAYGLIMAVVASRTNSRQLTRRRYTVGGKSIRDLWGKEWSIIKLLGSQAATRSPNRKERKRSD